jgi:thioredoxin 1
MQSLANLSFDEFEKILNDNKLVFVDFFASWCGPCKMFAPIVEQVSQKYEGKLKVLKVDIDESPEIAEKYSIQSVPTSILFKNNEIAERTSGLISLSQCSEFVDKHLN